MKQDQPYEGGTEVRVVIDGKIIGRLPRASGPTWDDHGWLYYIEGKDGRKRWVPDYNVEPRSAA